MKREVTNYPEFLEAMNELFATTAVCDIATYKTEMSASKERRKQKIAHISHQIKHLQEEINKYKEKIKQATVQNNKKESGIRLNQLITTKKALIKAYKEEKNTTPFTELSQDAKVYACANSLLQKYLFKAFVQTIPNAYQINQDQSVTVNVERFRNSVLYQQAQHIKDYINSYIEHYPQRVQGSRYFVGLHKSAQDMEDLVILADDYFDKMNASSTEDKEKLLKSRQGIEVVEIYPEHNAQAVKLLTKDALSYEGKEMNHCVASYGHQVEKGECEIYSIRDYGDETTEFIPHATIEYRNGKITQIKGYKDSIVDMDYIEDTRRLVMKLSHTDKFEDIINTKNIPDSEKINIGIIWGADRKFHDILDMLGCFESITVHKVVVKSVHLNNFPITKLNIKNLEVNGAINQKTINILSTAQNVQNIIFNGVLQTDGLDLSSLSLEKIEIELKKESNIQKIILSPSMKTVKLKGAFNHLIEINGDKEVNTLDLIGDFSELKTLPKEINRLSLEGDFRRLCPPKNLKRLQINKALIQLRDFPTYQNLTRLELTSGTYDNVEKLDFSSCQKLEVIDFSRCVFPDLKELVIPQSCVFFNGEHSSYPKLERLDLSHSTLKYFGKLERKPINPSKSQVYFDGRAIEGLLLNFSRLPQIKEIKFPKDIEEICMAGISLGKENPFNLASYDKLLSLYLVLCHIHKDMHIDLSQCKNLKEINSDISHLFHMTLPEKLDRLKIRIERFSSVKPDTLTDMKKYPQNMDKQLIKEVDLSQVKHIKILQTDFLLEKKYLPQAADKYEIYFFDHNHLCYSMQTLDFSSVKKLKCMLDNSIDLPNLQNIIFPEKFEFFFLNISPNLKEIDLTRTKGVLCLQEIGNYPMYVNNKSPILSTLNMLSDQLKTIKKIKLGREITDFICTLKETPANLTIELAADMSVDKEEKIKQKYPDIRITRAPFPPNRLLEAIIQNKPQSLR